MDVNTGPKELPTIPMPLAKEDGQPNSHHIDQFEFTAFKQAGENICGFVI